MATKRELLDQLDRLAPDHGLTMKSAKDDVEAALADLDADDPPAVQPAALTGSGKPVSLGGMCVQR